MKTSVQVMVLVSVVAVSTVYAFFLDIRRNRNTRRLLDWLKTERSEHWAALTRADRFLSVRAIEILRRGRLADDDEFHSRYQPTRHGTRFAVAMTVGVTGIALVVLGTSLFGWSW